MANITRHHPGARTTEAPRRVLTWIKDADVDPAVGITSCACVRRTLMIRLTTALLTLGVGMATATTAIAQGCFYGHCNPEASWCRLLCGSEQQQQIEAEEQQQNARSQWAPGYAETHHRSMYMYVPPHGSSTHLANGHRDMQKHTTEACTCTCHHTAVARICTKKLL